MSSFNAIAALAILDSPGLKDKISPDQKILGVGTAAVVNGTLGLLPPLLIAQQATGGGGVTPGDDVSVPDVSSDHPAEAAAASILKGDRLVAVKETAFSNEVDEGNVVSQDPPAGSLVPLNSNVTIVVSLGAPPLVPVPEDLDTDLTNKIKAATAELEGKIADNAAALGRIESKLDALPKPSKRSGSPGD